MSGQVRERGQEAWPQGCEDRGQAIGTVVGGPVRYAVGFTRTSKSACLKEGENIKSTTILGRVSMCVWVGKSQPHAKPLVKETS